MKESSGKWTPLTKSMIYSESFQDLTLSARRILDFVMIQREMIIASNKKSKKKTYSCVNPDDIYIPYSQLNNRPFSMKNQSVTRGIDCLLAHGFITVKEQGGSKKGHVTIYSLSEKWQDWKCGDDPISTRTPYRKRGFTLK